MKEKRVEYILPVPDGQKPLAYRVRIAASEFTKYSRFVLLGYEFYDVFYGVERYRLRFQIVDSD